MGGKCVALVPVVTKWILGASSHGGGCCQEAAVTPAVTGVSPRKVRALPCLLLPVQCNNNMPKCCFLQVSCQLLRDRGGSSRLEMSPALHKAKDLGFPMPEQHPSPKSLSPDTHSSAIGARKAPRASKFQSSGLDLRNKGAGCCSERGAGQQIRPLWSRQGWAGTAGLCWWLGPLVVK